MFVSPPQLSLRYSYVLLGALLFGVMFIAGIGWLLRRSPGGVDNTVLAGLMICAVALLGVAWCLYMERITLHAEGLWSRPAC